MKFIDISGDFFQECLMISALSFIEFLMER
jgi:hypothetical protein